MAFSGLTALVASGLTTQLDDAISKYFKILLVSESVDTTLVILASLGDIFTLVIVAIILTIIRRTRKAGVIFLTSIVIIVITTMYIKPLVARPLPPYKYEPISRITKNFVIEADSVVPFARGFSYPSNHVASITALAYIAGFELNRKFGRSSYVHLGLTNDYFRIQIVPDATPFYGCGSRILSWINYFSDLKQSNASRPAFFNVQISRK